MTPQQKAHYLARVEQAKDGTPGTQSFVRLLVFAVAFIVLWGKLVGAGA